MKKSKVLLSIIAVLFLLVVSACTVDDHTHSYGSWTVKEMPTETTYGIKERECSICGRLDHEMIPTLKDSNFWEVVEEKKSTCVEKGYIVYHDDELEDIKVVQPLGEHSYTKWNIVEDPTLEEKGLAKKVCDVCLKYGDEEMEVPAFSDEDFWEVVDEVKSTCIVKGSRTYQNELVGKKTIELPFSEHTFTEWTFTQEPTEEAGGVVTSLCEVCKKVSTEVEIPDLTDEEFWTKTEVTADYNNAGTAVYVCKYGSIKSATGKLVAPYDSKTYSSFNIDGDDDNGSWANKKLSVGTSWTTATITLNELGEGFGTAYPFNYYYQIKMVDPKTGEIEMIRSSKDTSDPEHVVPRPNTATTIHAFVDMKTGIIVMPYSAAFNNVHVLTPFEVGVTNDKVKASVWPKAMAISYTYSDEVYNIFVEEDKVYFGVSFVNMKGEAVAADEAYKSDYVYVKDAKGNVIASYGYNGTAEVKVDGFEGTYHNEKDLFVSGFGTVTYDDAEGTYEIVDENVLGIYVDGKYYEVTVDVKAKTYEMTMPTVTITYDAGEYADVKAEEVNKNIAHKLPVPTNDEYVFKGWFYDNDCKKAVEEEFIPTEDVTLYALWKVKVVIKLEGVKDGDPKELILGEDDVIGDFLPKYGVDLENNEVFRGWYVDAKFEETLSEDAAVSVEDSNMTIYAKWEELPAYYGTYYGTELWGASSGNSDNRHVTFDENGNITGSHTGIVQSYNPETHEIIWKKSATDSNQYKFFYYEDSEILLYDFSGKNYVGHDFYIYSKNLPTTGKVEDYYGIKCINPNGSDTNYFLSLIKLNTPKGVITVVRYGSIIYSNVSITDTQGKELTIDEAKNSKTLVVVDKATSKIVIALASKGDSFAKQNETVALDDYWGTYTNGDETVILDGTGVITYGEKTGTYTKSKSEDYEFDVYLEDHTEYYRLTLKDKTFTMEKYMVTITFVTDKNHDPIEAQQFNANVSVNGKLPNFDKIGEIDDKGYVFNGWFFDEDFKQAVPADFIPTEDDTLYAKYSNPATLTIVYNNGEEDDEIVYSVGDIVNVERPDYAKHKFVGWYTTKDFQENSKWESGTAIEKDLTIYAKWEDAPIYNNNYGGTTGITKSNKSDVDGKASLNDRDGAYLDIDPYGNAPAVGYWPLSGSKTIQVTSFNEKTGEISITSGDGTVFKGYVDLESAILILFYTSDKGVWFFSPFEGHTNIKSKISASFWQNGDAIVIEYTKAEDEVYRIFVLGDKVYFGVDFVDGYGKAIKGADCYNHTTDKVVINDKDGKLIAEYAHDGKTLQPLDGLQGTYKNGTETLVINGVNKATLNDKVGEYFHAKEGSAYTLDVYVDGSFYEVTLNQKELTYTINKPMVDVIFDTDEKADVPTVSHNKNTELKLPEPKNDDYVFRGWFTDPDFKTPVEVPFVPTEKTTLYAKWDLKVKVVVVYGNGMETVTIDSAVGNILELKAPDPKDGKAFDGWYLDDKFQEKYVEGKPLEGPLTIYAKWIDATPLYGEYVGFEIWRYSKGNPNVSNGKTLSVSALGKFSGIKSGDLEEYDPKTGVFHLNDGSYGYFDEENGIIAMAYNTQKPDLTNDVYIFIRCEKIDILSANCSLFEDLHTQIISFKVDGVEKNILVYNEKIYCDVTWTSTDGEVASGKLYDAKQVTFFDSKGEEIVSFENGQEVK